MSKNYTWQQAYQSKLDLGISSPEGHTVLPFQEPPFVLTAAAMDKYGSVPNTINPSGMLYRSGTENRYLLSSSAPKCDGCLNMAEKPDPRVFQVKPLYTAHTFKASDNAPLPNAYNVTGMY